MKNSTELRKELSQLYEEVKSKKISVGEAKVLIQASNAMINSAKTELNQNKFLGKKKAIQFLS